MCGCGGWFGWASWTGLCCVMVGCCFLLGALTWFGLGLVKVVCWMVVWNLLICFGKGGGVCGVCVSVTF